MVLVKLLKVGGIAIHSPVVSFSRQHTVVLVCDCQWGWVVWCGELPRLWLLYQHSISNLYVRILHRSPALSESLHLDFLVCIMLTQ